MTRQPAEGRSSHGGLRFAWRNGERLYYRTRDSLLPEGKDDGCIGLVMVVMKDKPRHNIKLENKHGHLKIR
jgi:hypothetical protein